MKMEITKIKTKLSQLTCEIEALEAALRVPENPGQHSVALDLLFNTFADIKPASEGRMAAYLVAVGSLSVRAVKEAVIRFNSGLVSWHDGRFIPTPPMIARVAREQMAEARADLRSAQIHQRRYQLAYLNSPTCNLEEGRKHEKRHELDAAWDGENGKGLRHSGDLTRISKVGKAAKSIMKLTETAR